MMMRTIGPGEEEEDDDEKQERKHFFQLHADVKVIGIIIHKLSPDQDGGDGEVMKMMMITMGAKRSGPR